MEDFSLQILEENEKQFMDSGFKNESEMENSKRMRIFVAVGWLGSSIDLP